MRPFSNLHSLELIECMDYDAGSIMSLVTLTPHVTHLTIVDGSGYESILQCITRSFLKNGTKSWQKVKVLMSSWLDVPPLFPYIDFALMVGNPKLVICIETGDWSFDDIRGAHSSHF